MRGESPSSQRAASRADCFMSSDDAQGETELCARLVNLVADFDLVPMEDIPLPIDLFLLRPDGGSSSSGSDDGEDASADDEDASWGVGLRADDDDDEDFVPRRASDDHAPRGILIDFGGDEPRRRDVAGDEEDDDDAESDDDVENPIDSQDDGAPVDPATLDDEPTATGDPLDAVDADSDDVPTLKAADPSPTSSSISSPGLAHDSPPTPSDSPEPPFDDADAAHPAAGKQTADPPVAAAA